MKVTFESIERHWQQIEARMEAHHRAWKAAQASGTPVKPYEPTARELARRNLALSNFDNGQGGE